MQCVIDDPFACQPGQHWDELQNECVPDAPLCDPGYHWDAVVGACVQDNVSLPLFAFGDWVLITAPEDTGINGKVARVLTVIQNGGFFWPPSYSYYGTVYEVVVNEPPFYSRMVPEPWLTLTTPPV